MPHLKIEDISRMRLTGWERGIWETVGCKDERGYIGAARGKATSLLLYFREVMGGLTDLFTRRRHAGQRSRKSHGQCTNGKRSKECIYRATEE